MTYMKNFLRQIFCLIFLCKNYFLFMKICKTAYFVSKFLPDNFAEFSPLELKYSFPLVFFFLNNGQLI